jgi:DNA polymerase III subunit gamma/tau
MAGVRIRWRGVARAAAIVVVGLIALRLLPGLLHAPEPPPLGADVGLPRAKPAPVVDDRAPQPPRERPRREKPTAHRRKARAWRKVPVVPDQPASKAVIGTAPKHRHASRSRHRPSHRHAPRHHVTAVPPSPTTVESSPPTVPEYVPPPPAEPTPTPLPEAAPTPSPTPGDGSEEFAPH